MTLATVRKRIAGACERVGRDPAGVRIVVVSKGRSPAQILDVYQAGQRDFGENRAQELIAKVPVLPDDIRWHFVGPLQRNKVRRVRPVTTLLHSLDRFELAEAWIKGPGPAPPALVEVNVGREEQKHGVLPEDAAGLVEECLRLGVEVRGLMAIPPQGSAREHFDTLRELRDRVAERFPQVAEISAGMSDDLEEAVEMGATIVRPGRAIFE